MPEYSPWQPPHSPVAQPQKFSPVGSWWNLALRSLAAHAFPTPAEKPWNGGQWLLRSLWPLGWRGRMEWIQSLPLLCWSSHTSCTVGCLASVGHRKGVLNNISNSNQQLHCTLLLFSFIALYFYFQIFISKIYNSYIIICFWKKLKFERVFIGVQQGSSVMAFNTYV